MNNSSDQFKRFSFYGDSPYQYIRAIRFRSNPPTQQSGCFKEKLNKVNSTEENFKLSKFSEELNKIKENLENIFYCKTSEKNQKEKGKNNFKNLDVSKKKDYFNFNKSISVKLAWLRIYHKDIFCLLIKKPQNEISNSYTKKDNKQKRWSLHKDLKNIHSDFNNNFEILNEVFKQIETASKTPEEEQNRYSDISHAIKQLKVKFPYFINFLKESHTSKPDFDKQIDETIKKYECLPMEIAEQRYLSNKDSGMEIAKASFNYYTVNKKPKEYEEKIEEIERKLNSQSYTRFCENTKGNIEWKWSEKNNSSRGNHKQKNQNIFIFQSDLEKEWVKNG